MVWEGSNEVTMRAKYSQTPYGDFWTDSVRFFVGTRYKIMTHPEATFFSFLAHSGSVRNLAGSSSYVPRLMEPEVQQAPGNYVQSFTIEAL